MNLFKYSKAFGCIDFNNFSSKIFPSYELPKILAQEIVIVFKLSSNAALFCNKITACASVNVSSPIVSAPLKFASIDKVLLLTFFKLFSSMISNGPLINIFAACVEILVTLGASNIIKHLSNLFNCRISLISFTSNFE